MNNYELYAKNKEMEDNANDPIPVTLKTVKWRMKILACQIRKILHCIETEIEDNLSFITFQKNFQNVDSSEDLTDHLRHDLEIVTWFYQVSAKTLRENKGALASLALIGKLGYQNGLSFVGQQSRDNFNEEIGRVEV